MRKEHLFALMSGLRKQTIEHWSTIAPSLRCERVLPSNAALMKYALLCHSRLTSSPVATGGCKEGPVCIQSCFRPSGLLLQDCGRLKSPWRMPMVELGVSYNKLGRDRVPPLCCRAGNEQEPPAGLRVLQRDQTEA